LSLGPKREHLAMQNIPGLIFYTGLFLITLWVISALIMLFFIGVRTNQLPAKSRLEKEFVETQAALWKHQIYWVPYLLYYNSTKPWRKRRDDIQKECDRLMMQIEAFERK
jgi:hypothetical protein